MQFGYHSAHADHWYDLDGRESDMVAVYTHPDGDLRPSIDLVLYRQSISDYRYLMFLDRLVKSSTSPATAEPRRWLAGLLDKMRIGEPSPWRDEEMDRIRALAVTHIDAIRKAP